jgi:signal transduction histidine kinase
MSSRSPERLQHALALRLALWYSILFVAGAVALIGFAYVLLSRSLIAQDHSVMATMLDRYASEYESGGLPLLDRAITADRLEGRHERLLVRVAGRGTDLIYFNVPEGWNNFDLNQLNRPAPAGSVWSSLARTADGAVLDIVATRLRDGTLIQVGRSSDVRDQLLSHFRSRVTWMLAFVLTIAVIGGAVLTYVGLAPVRDMASTVRAIVETGRLEARVPVRHGGDALNELGVLVNGMLDRIQTLITGMRGALDSVAHDLRTPLMRVRSVAESALNASDEADVREGLVRVLEETERLNATLTTLMDISEAETGTMKLTRERMRVADVVSEAIELYADLAEEKGVALRTSIDRPAEPGKETLPLPQLEINADRARLRQVLANLIDNALKYTGRGGTIEVMASADENGVTLAVHDNGIGIAPEALPHVWERLYRADASRSERGLGLGLSLVRAIVEGHGGRVAVRSEVGQGSVFSVTFPRG